MGGISRGLFVGRFQPFHHGHFEVVKRLLKKHDEIVLVIGSAEEANTKDNPFTAGERMEMIRSAFGQRSRSRIIIVPVRDINDHSRWVDHVRAYVPHFDVVYSNNELVARLFRDAGCNVEPIEYVDRGTNEGRYIRELMKKGDDGWKRHVPDGAVKFIDRIDGTARLRAMNG